MKLKEFIDESTAEDVEIGFTAGFLITILIWMVMRVVCGSYLREHIPQEYPVHLVIALFTSNMVLSVFVAWLRIKLRIKRRKL